MNVKTLSIAVGLLAILSALVAFFDRPAAPLDADPRIGQPVLPAAIAANATRLTLTQNGQSVTLDRNEEATWQVSSYHDFPADFAKLRRFIGDLTAATISRVVTRLTERIDRLGFGDAALSITTADGTAWQVDLGKNSDLGGRYARFESDDGAPAYLIDLSAALDSTAKNWAVADLLTVEPTDIAAVSLSFANAPTVAANRTSADAPWNNANAPDTRTVNATRLGSLVTALTNLRFTATSRADAPDVIEARDHARTATLKTFAGDTLTLSIGRRPEVILPVESTASDASDTAPTSEPPAPTTVPAGPVFVSITGPAALAPLAHHDQLAFQISDYTFTALPQTPAYRTKSLRMFVTY